MSEWRCVNFTQHCHFVPNTADACQTNADLSIPAQIKDLALQVKIDLVSFKVQLGRTPPVQVAHSQVSAFSFINFLFLPHFCPARHFFASVVKRYVELTIKSVGVWIFGSTEGPIKYVASPTSPLISPDFVHLEV